VSWTSQYTGVRGWAWVDMERAKPTTRRANRRNENQVGMSLGRAVLALRKREEIVRPGYTLGKLHGSR
jgi:cysteine synthase